MAPQQTSRRAGKAGQSVGQRAKPCLLLADAKDHTHSARNLPAWLTHRHGRNIPVHKRDSLPDFLLLPRTCRSEAHAPGGRLMQDVICIEIG